MNESTFTRQVYLALQLSDVLVLMAQLNLALKHPANNGIASLAARRMVRQFADVLVREGTMSRTELNYLLDVGVQDEIAALWEVR